MPSTIAGKSKFTALADKYRSSSRMRLTRSVSKEHMLTVDHLGGMAADVLEQVLAPEIEVSGVAKVP